MSMVKPLADLSDRVATAEQRDFGFQESWLRELERAQGNLLGHASSPGEHSSPAAEPPRVPAFAALPPLEVRGPGALHVRGPVQGTRAKEFAVRATVGRPETPRIANVTPAADVPESSSTSLPARVVSRDASVLPATTTSVDLHSSAQVAGDAVASQPAQASTGDASVAAAPVRPVQMPQIESAVTANAPSAGASEIATSSAVESEGSSQPASSFPAPSLALANGPESPSIAPERVIIAPAASSSADAPAARTQSKAQPTSAGAAPERADPPPRRRIHVQANESEASVWVRDLELDPAQSQGLLARVAAQMTLAGRKLRSFAVNGRVILGPARAKDRDATEARDNPIQQAKR